MDQIEKQQRLCCKIYFAKHDEEIREMFYDEVVNYAEEEANANDYYGELKQSSDDDLVMQRYVALKSSVDKILEEFKEFILDTCPFITPIKMLEYMKMHLDREEKWKDNVPEQLRHYYGDKLEYKKIWVDWN